MAVSVTANLSLASNADTASSQGTWSGNSGAADNEVYIQGSGSYTWQASKNARTSCTFTPTTNLDMSATDTHFYWWAKNDVAPFMEAKTTGTTTASGYTIRFTDGSGNYVEFHIAGSDTWGGEWKCFVIDLANTSQIYASSGTMGWNDVDVITWYVDISNSGNIRIIDNQWNDVCRYGTGLTATGTSFDLADIAADDESTTNRYGILENIDGVIFCQGRLTIGNGATTTTFSSTNEALVFRDRAGQGEGSVKSSLYQLVFTGSGCTATMSEAVVKGAGTTVDTRFYLDADDTNADVTISGSSFTRAGLVDFASTSVVQDTVFNDCYQIDPSTGTFQGNTTKNYTGTDGALLWPGGTTVQGCSFEDNDRAIEITQTSTQTFTDLLFSSNTYDVHLNNGGTSITVNKSGTSDPTTYIATGGGTVTFSASYTQTLTGIIPGSEVTWTKLPTADDTGTDGSSLTGSRSFVTTKNLTTDEHKGKLLTIESGDDAGRYYISGNNTSTLYLDAELSNTASSLSYSIYDENSVTVLEHVESVAANGQATYTYGTSGQFADILIFKENYYDYVLPDISLPSSNSSVPVVQIPDPNYYNPT